MHQMNPVKRFGAKVSERNGDWTKMWQRHLEGKTERQAGTRVPKVEQGLVEDVAKRHFEGKTERQAGTRVPKVEQGLASGCKEGQRSSKDWGSG